MSIKTLAVVAAIAASTVATGAAAQSVTPAEVLKLPVGTKYVTKDGILFIVRTAKGFRVGATGVPHTVDCNNVTKSGGHGNATVNCTGATKGEIRFEWININSMKLESWANLAAKLGELRHKPPQSSVILTRK